MSDRVYFLDTTSRDGKQAPGCAFSPRDTVRLAEQAEAVGIDIFEAGFAASSENDSDAIAMVAGRMRTMQVCSFGRSCREDVMASVRVLDSARVSPRIHTFVATSDIHLEHKLKMSRAAALEKAVSTIELARQYVDDVEFSAEDAMRSDETYLASVIKAVILAGARTVNIPDTVGYRAPDEIAARITRLIAMVPEITEYGVVVSVHCHNDLGMATANSLAGLKAGARQVECTINGIGERAGNAHYAEVAMALSTRCDYYGLEHGIQTREIGKTANLLSEIIERPVPPTMPVVGEYVFAHGSGVHQHGMSGNVETYEIMSPESVGWYGEPYPLSSHSGRTGLSMRLERLGYHLGANALDMVYVDFLKVASTQRIVDDDTLHQLVHEQQHMVV